jgi:hypothetical protein
MANKKIQRSGINDKALHIFAGGLQIPATNLLVLNVDEG